MTDSPVQLYYWSVEFNDGYSFSQFDREGNEIHPKNFCPNQYLKDGKIQENCNVFENLEKIHGRVVKAGWYPFTAEFAATCMIKQPNLRIAIQKDLSPIEKEVNETFYSTYFLKNVSIKYGLSPDKREVPIDQFQSAIHIGLFPRDGVNDVPDILTANLRYQ